MPVRMPSESMITTDNNQQYGDNECQKIKFEPQ